VWSPIETVAVLLGIANIVLIIRRSVWNYPFGIVMVTLYAVIFFEAKLYSDSGLQIFFLFVQLYGLWAWKQNQAQAGEIGVEKLGKQQFTIVLLSSLAITAVWGFVMASHTDTSYPYWDASVAMLSVIAQLLLTWRYLENWYWWIVVDVISIPLYIVKELYLTAGLYVLFLALAITGLLQWRKARLA
jgi:nicotinamide mononucleotide transporter